MGNKASQTKKNSKADPEDDQHATQKLHSPRAFASNDVSADTYFPATQIDEPMTGGNPAPDLQIDEHEVKADSLSTSKQHGPYTPQPGFNNRILLFGFIRDIERGLHGQTMMTIVPDTVMQLCDAYYSTPNTIFYIEPANVANSHHLCIVDLDDMDRDIKKQHTFGVAELGANQINSVRNAGIYHQSKIKIPSQMLTALPPSMTENVDDDTHWDVIFKCGGTAPNGISQCNPTYCCAYVWRNDDKYFEHIHRVALPDYPTMTAVAQSLIWSDKQQKLYSLTKRNIDVFSLADWEWRSLQHDMHAARKRSGFMSSVMLQNDEGQEQIVCVGGDLQGLPNKGSKFCDLYDVQQNTWYALSDMHFERQKTGIYHDKWQQRVFVGGGNSAERKIEFYDLNKNTWYFDRNSIPLTNEKHNVYPIIWLQEGRRLYISSVKANAVEMIDLREENRRWNVVYDSLDPLFGTHIEWFKAMNCRLIQ